MHTATVRSNSPNFDLIIVKSAGAADKTAAPALFFAALSVFDGNDAVVPLDHIQIAVYIFGIVGALTRLDRKTAVLREILFDPPDDVYERLLQFKESKFIKFIVTNGDHPCRRM